MTIVKSDYIRMTDRIRTDNGTSFPFYDKLREEDTAISRFPQSPNTTINNILHSIKDKHFLWCRKPLPEHLPKKNLGKYYSFHKRTGYAIRGCWALRDQSKNCWIRGTVGSLLGIRQGRKIQLNLRTEICQTSTLMMKIEDKGNVLRCVSCPEPGVIEKIWPRA